MPSPRGAAARAWPLDEAKGARPAPSGSLPASPYFRRRSWMTTALLVPIGALAVLSRPAPIHPFAEVVLDAAGYGALALGVALRLWASLYIGDRKGRVLVVEGPYAIVRNPLYLGSFLIVLAGAFFLRSLLFAAGLALVVALYARTIVPEEERLLRTLFGRAYERYVERTPRWIPRPSLWRTPTSIEVSVQGLRVEALRAAAYVWVPVYAEVLHVLRTAEWWPGPFRFL